jgi:hypothetical protein
MAEEAAGTIPRADRKDFESSKYVRTENPQKLERDPHVQREIQKTLEKRGLDERSKEHFVNLMWRYAESEKAEDEKRQLQAMRILGKALVAEQVQVDQPETLPLAGLEAGLQKMGLGDDVISKVGPAPETDLEDDESARFDA